jgi:hypothetical protein
VSISADRCRLMTLVAPRACTNKAEGRMYLSPRRMHLDSWKAAKRLSRTGMADGGSHRRQIPDERDHSGPGRVK